MRQKHSQTQREGQVFTEAGLGRKDWDFVILEEQTILHRMEKKQGLIVQHWGLHPNIL